MAFHTIKLKEPEPGVGLITLNRPERLNALSLEMVRELHELFGQLGPGVRFRVLVITGEGRAFCSGADLKDDRFRGEAAGLYSNAAEHLFTIQKRYADLIVRMRRMSQPIVAAVNGPAVGGGMSIAIAADVILASPAATFIPAFINIGLTGGDMGSSYFLPRLVGPARAAEILMTGRAVGAEEAERIGLVSSLVREGSVVETAIEVARRMLEKSPVGLRLTKEVLNQNMHAPSLEAAIELENRNQSMCCVTSEFKEAIERFKKKSTGDGK